MCRSTKQQCLPDGESWETSSSLSITATSLFTGIQHVLSRQCLKMCLFEFEGFLSTPPPCLPCSGVKSYNPMERPDSTHFLWILQQTEEFKRSWSPNSLFRHPVKLGHISYILCMKTHRYLYIIFFYFFLLFYHSSRPNLTVFNAKWHFQRI